MTRQVFHIDNNFDDEDELYLDGANDSKKGNDWGETAFPNTIFFISYNYNFIMFLTKWLRVMRKNWFLHDTHVWKIDSQRETKGGFGLGWRGHREEIILSTIPWLQDYQIHHISGESGSSNKTCFVNDENENSFTEFKGAHGKSISSNVVYKLTCTGRMSSYVGFTTRHFITRKKDHMGKRELFGRHFIDCSENPNK